jgi:Rod binding domain-containing protein
MASPELLETAQDARSRSDSLSPFLFLTGSQGRGPRTEPVKIQNGYSLTPKDQADIAEKRDLQLRNAAKMYETHFLNEMVKAMRKTVPQDEGVFKHNFAEQIFTEQLDSQYVEGWSGRGGVGLADMIYSQLKNRFGGAEGRKLPARGTLPIAPKKEPLGMKPVESIRMKAIPPSADAKLHYRFEVQEPRAEGFEAQVPMAGKLVDAHILDDGWNLVKLDHGQGLTSELTFPGTVTESGPGTEVEPGLRLGYLDQTRPVLAWKLDWT